MKKFLSFLGAYLASALSLFAVSGNPADIQAAIDASPPGGAVTIDNGSYSWNRGIRINKALKLLGTTKGGVKISAPNARTNLIAVTEPASGNVEIANLDCDFSKASDAWVYMVYVTPGAPRGTGRVILHDCSFVTNYAYAIEWDTNGGVIYNCLFDGTRSGGLTGISFVCRGLPQDWTRPSTLGILDAHGLSNTYVEDCIIKNANVGCSNLDDNSRTVWRHCVFDNAEVGSHGQETSPAGARQWEFYDNQFLCDSQNKWNLNCYLMFRGGTGVVCDNSMQKIPWGKVEVQLCVFNIRRRGQIPCQTQYPAARQVGQGWIGKGGYSYPSVPPNGTGYTTDPIYFWNNAGSCIVALNEYQPDECGNGQQIANYVKKGRDYFEGQAKPGYSKAVYPHPLRSGGPTPTPTPARRTERKT